MKFGIHFVSWQEFVSHTRFAFVILVILELSCHNLHIVFTLFIYRVSSIHLTDLVSFALYVFVFLGSGQQFHRWKSTEMCRGSQTTYWCCGRTDYICILTRICFISCQNQSCGMWLTFLPFILFINTIHTCLYNCKQNRFWCAIT